IPFHRKTLTPLSFHAITFSFKVDNDQSLFRLLPDRKIRLPISNRLTENYERMRLADKEHHLSNSIQRLKQHYFQDLWIMIIQQNQRYLENDPFAADDDLMREIADYFNQHAHEKLQMRSIAAMYGLTPAHLISRFRSVYRLNPLEYLTSVRVKNACRLLLTTEWTLDVIA